jgi:hypothetical protein
MKEREEKRLEDGAAIMKIKETDITVSYGGGRGEDQGLGLEDVLCDLSIRCVRDYLMVGIG